ncbi:MAG: TonB-dependent receptor [Bacteroidales bacterium]|nr:TonB-dependent receptor [Bacteroidales bacterium]
MKHNKLFSIALSVILTILVAMPAIAQNQVKGTVIDENNEPVIGASVMIVGQKGAGTVTDLNGNYVLNVAKDTKIKVSYIGYETVEVTAGATVKLKPADTTLNEVVVVGYGSRKRAHLTGSVATVPVEEITDLSSGNLASTLSGLVNGVSVSGGESRPGESATITIRGNSGGPLYVIDGYIYPNEVKVGTASENLGETAFNNLDPTTIESISVLKDAAAAVYGARAANGVILVTTKKGRIGAPQISYSGTFGLTDAVATPKMLDTYDYGRLVNAVVAADPKNTIDSKRDIFQADELEAMKTLDYDLLDKYWKTAFTQKHAVNISGATERANYYSSVSYFKQDGNLGKLDYDRWNFRAGTDVKVTKWMKAGLSINGDYGKKNKPLVKVGGSGSERDYQSLLFRPRYIPESVEGYDIAAYGLSNTQVNQNQNYNFNVLQNSGDFNRNQTSNINISGNIDIDFGEIYKPLKGLTARVSYSKSISQNTGDEYGSSYDLYKMVIRSGSGEHLYTPIAGQEAEWEALMTENNFLLANNGKPISNGQEGGYLRRAMTRTDNYQLNFNVNYARDFGQHHVGALFSIEKSESSSRYVDGMVTHPYEFTTGEFNSVTFESIPTTNSYRSEAGSLSYIGRLNYAYADKYLFEFLFRSDASTKFAPENYWGYFPSASAGWVISQEEWFQKNVTWVDYLKARISFGLTGRDNTNFWQWLQTYGTDKDKGAVFGDGTSNNAGSHITLNKNNSAVNRDAHWDKSYKFNTGIDANFLNNRLSVGLEYYYQWDREKLMAYSETIPTTIGTQSANLNWGKSDRWGVELSLNWKDRIGKDFKYRVGINTGYSDDKVILQEWNTGDTQYRSVYEGHRADMGTWGLQCLGMFRSFQDIEEYFAKLSEDSGVDIDDIRYMGMVKDDVRPGMLIYKDVRGKKDENGNYTGPDGSVDETFDLVELNHRSNPYGFTANLGCDYKSFSLTAQLSASWGGYSFLDSSMLSFNSIYEKSNMPSFWKVDNMYSYQDVYDNSGNLVVAENRSGYYPNLAYGINSKTSSFWRISGTRIRLSRITLAYKLPSEWLKPIGINSVRLNVTGQNLLSLYNPYPDNFMDPMSSWTAYPTLRKWTIGVNVSF